MFDYRLGLATGIDLPIPELQTVIHQPSILEISYLGEKDFLTGVQLLSLNKSMYAGDAALLENTSNFQILMSILQEKQIDAQQRESVKAVLRMLFPQYAVLFTPRSIVLNSSESNVTIDEGNFQVLQDLIGQMFCLSKTDAQTFNPANAKAKEIADKLMRARQKVAKAKEAEGGSGSMFGQYLSIITVGVNSMNLKDTMALTMYQLYDLVERYSLYMNWDIDIRGRMAGAKNDKPIENWMKNIH